MSSVLKVKLGKLSPQMTGFKARPGSLGLRLGPAVLYVEDGVSWGTQLWGARLAGPLARSTQHHRSEREGF